MSGSCAKQIRLIIIIAMLAAIAALGLLFVTRPYALTADGHRTYEAFAVKTGDSSIAYVQTEKEGKEVIENIKKAYYQGDEPEDLNISPAITVEKRELKRNEPLQLKEPTEAAREIVASDKNAANPTITVSYTATKEKETAIEYKTVYKKTESLNKGQSKVAKAGKTGKKVITSKVQYENGKAVKTEVVSKKVAKKAENRVIYKGTKEVVKTTATALNESPAKIKRTASVTTTHKRRGSGQAVADYACRFVGNPYVYGGSSLTKGTDCSGFVMSVYAHFGVSLPHSASAIGTYGKGVSYKNASPGDVIVYPGHCGIYIGGGKVVHASDPSRGIIVSNALYDSPTTIRHIK